MNKRVELPNGEFAEFPNDMDNDAIASVIAKEFPAPKKVDTAKNSVMKDSESVESKSPMRPEFVESVKREYDNATPEQRKAMAKDKDSAAGRIAAQRGVNYDKLDRQTKQSTTDQVINRTLNKPVGGIEMPKMVGTQNMADGRKEAPKPVAKPKEIFRDRTGLEIAKDTALDVGIGVSNIVGAAPNLISPDGEFAKATRDASQSMRDLQSDPMQQQLERVNQRIEQAGAKGGLDGAADQFGQALREYGDNPALAASLIVQNLPSFVPGLAVGKLLQMAPKVLPALKMLASSGVALTGAAITNAVMNAGGARGEAYEDLLETQLDKNVPKSVAEDRAVEGSVIPAAIGGVTGLISGGSGLEKAVFGKGAGTIGDALRGAAKEFASEQAEEVAPKIATNIEASQYDDRSALKDVGRTVAETAIASFPTTAGSAAIDIWKSRPEKKLADFIGESGEQTPEMTKARKALEKRAAKKAAETSQQQQSAPAQTTAPVVDQETGEIISQAETPVQVTFLDGEVMPGRVVGTFEEDGTQFSRVISEDGELYIIGPDDAKIEPIGQTAQAAPVSEAVEQPIEQPKPAEVEQEPAIAQPITQQAPVSNSPDLTALSDEELATMARTAQDKGVRSKIAAERRARREKMLSEQASLPKSGSDKPASMPKDLAGAKPRYSYGSKQFDVEFESDVDRAAYIAAQKNPSKRDADYLKFVMDATGMDEAQVRAHGQKVRDAIKGMAKDAEPGVLKIENQSVTSNVASEKPASLPLNGSDNVTKDKKYFDKMTVVDMTDEDLELAKQFYPEGSKRLATIAKQQEKRKGAQVTGNVASEPYQIKAGDWYKNWSEGIIKQANLPEAEAEKARAEKVDWTMHQDFLESALEKKKKIPADVLEDYRANGIVVDPKGWPKLAKALGPTKTEQIEGTGLTSKQEELLTPSERAQQRKVEEAEQLKVIDQVVSGSQALKDIGVANEAMGLANRIKGLQGTPEGEQAGKMLLSYIKGREDDAKAGRKADPAFFTENFAKKIATLLDTTDSGKDKKQYAPIDLNQWKKEFPNLAKEGFTDALPQGLVNEGLRVFNEANQKLADLGYDPGLESIRIMEQKKSSLPKEVQDLLNKRRVMTWLSVVARRRVKNQREGKENTARVQDRTERQTLEMFGIDSTQFPGVDSTVKLQDGNEKGTFKKGGEDTRQQSDIEMSPLLENMDPTTRATFKVDEAIEKAKTTDIGYIISDKPEADNRSEAEYAFTPERAMFGYIRARDAMKDTDGMLRSGNRTGATKSELIESFVQANQYKNSIEKSKLENPELWAAYEQRQSEVAKLEVGDEVVLPFGPAPTGKIEKKYPRRWKIVDKTGHTFMLEPSMIRPAQGQSKQEDSTAAEWTRTPTVQREAILKRAGLSDALKNKAFDDIGGPGQKKIERAMLEPQGGAPTLEQLEKDLDEAKDKYESQGMVKNANTSSRIRELENAIQEIKNPEILKALNGDGKLTGIVAQAIEFDLSKGSKEATVRAALKNRGTVEPYLSQMTSKVLEAIGEKQSDNLLAQIESLEAKAQPVNGEETMRQAKELSALNEKLYAQNPKARDWFAKRPNEKLLQEPRRGEVQRAGGEKVGVTYAVFSNGKSVRVRTITDDGKFIDDSGYRHPENITPTREEAAIRAATYNIGPESKETQKSVAQPESIVGGAGYNLPADRIVTNVQRAFKSGEVQATAIGTTDDGFVNFGSNFPDGRYYIESKDEAIGFKDGQWGPFEGNKIQPQGTYDPDNLEAETIRVLTEAGAKTREAPKKNESNLPQSESQAVNDFVSGNRDDVPTVDEVKAEQESLFSNNTIFTADKVEAARALLRKKLGQLNSGFDPEMLQAGTTIAGAYIEAGVKKFADFSRAMVKDFGEEIRPYLRSFYEGIRHFPAVNRDGMTSPEELDALEKAQSSQKTLNTPEGRFAIAQQLADFFVGGGKFDTIVQARKKIEELTGERVESATSGAKLADEVVETAVVLAGREIVDSGRKMNRPAHIIYDRLVDLYSRQPNLSVRTSTSVAEQAYSTPAPLAFIASELAGITGKSKVYEPSAGNGMLLIGADVKNSIANELNDYRVNSLARVLDGAQIQNQDATQWAPSARSVDAVIQNPPFGAVKDESGQTMKFEILPDYVTSEIDHAIVFKSLESMKDDGRAVLIVGGTMAKDEESRAQDYRGKSKRTFYFNLYNQYNVVDHFTINGAMYSKQGASYPVDVIVIDGRGKSNRDLPAADVPKIIQNYTELKGKLDENYRLGTDKNSGANRTDSGGTAAGQGNKANVDGSAAKQSDQNGNAGTRVDARNQPGVDTNGNSGGTGQPGRSGAISGGRELQPENASNNSDAGRTGVSGGNQAEGTAATSPSAGRNEPPKLDGTSVVSGERQQSGLTDRRGQEEETATQLAYTPKSGAASVGTLVPRAMADSIQKSLERIQQAKGDIDQFVADALKMPIKTVQSNFSAEQIDALALSIDNAEKGSGFIIGDQTGIGKGRVVAAMIRYALVSGKTPIFVTEKPNLYSDMIRDLDDIGMTDELKLDTATPRILMTNGSESVPYTLIRTVKGEPVETNLTLKPPKRGKELNEMFKKMQDDKSLGDYKVIFTTYSQLQTVKGAATERMNFVRTFGTGGYMIFDESHNAGGAGEPSQARSSEQREKSKNGESLVEGRAAFVRSMVEASNGSFFSSATYAKRPDVMDLYSSTNMRLAVDNISELGKAIKEGGVPMQQVVANMLTQDGQYIRRERTFAGVTYQTKEAAVDRQTAENMATAMRSILAFSRKKQVAIKQYQKELDKQGSLVRSFQTEKTQVESANFGAIMHNLIDQMLLALKAKQSVDFAVERLKQGEKVVMTVSNTMGSFLSEYAEQEGLSKGDMVNMTFGDMYLRYLEKQLEITVKAPNGETTKKKMDPSILGETLYGQYQAIKKMIEESEFGTAPISPIDYMKAEIAKAGYKADEITGRTVALDYSTGTPTLTSRTASIKQRVRAVSGFNNGEIDVLILNQAGSTGLSLHASSKFKDQRKRHMIIVQAEKNIDTHMQMLGRVHRTGQVIAPAYSQMMAAIPAEMRPAAVLMKKMASLNANTTASRKSSVTAEGVVDFINEYGGQIAAEFLQDNPEVWASLGGSDVIKVPENAAEADEDLIRKLTGYIPVLPIKKQEEIYADLIQRYDELIERETSMGTNKLEAAAMDLDARTLSSEALTEDRGVDSIFAKPAYMEQVSVKRTVKPMSSDEVKAAIEKTLGQLSPSKFNADLRAEVTQAAKDYLEESYKAFGTTEDDVIKRGELTVRTNAALSKIEMILDTYRVGDPITLTIGEGGTVVYGIITNIAKKGKSQSPVANSTFAMTVALANGDAKSLQIPFSKIGNGYSLQTTQRVNFYNPETQQFEMTPVGQIFDKGATVRREKRWVVTGNILAGYSQYKGQISSYTKEDGSIGQGVLMPRSFDFIKAKNSAAYIFKDATEILSFIQNGYGNQVHSKDGVVKILRSGMDALLTVPSSKKDGGNYYLDKELLKIIDRDFIKSGSTMQARVSSTDLQAVFDHLRSKHSVKFIAGTNNDVAKGMFQKDQAQTDSQQRPGNRMYSLKGNVKEIGRIKSLFGNGKLTEQAVPKLVDKLMQNRRVVLKSPVNKGKNASAVLQWLLDRNPNIDKNLVNIIFTDDVEAGVSGFYEVSSRNLVLNTELNDPTVGVHEALHHAERMLPPDVQAQIRNLWLRDWNKAFTAGDKETKEFLLDMAAASLGDDEAFDKTMSQLKDKGKFRAADWYHLYSPSEYWAVKGSDYLLDLATEGWIKKAIRWMREFVDFLQNKLGLNDDHNMVKAFKYILNEADGEFKSETLIEASAGTGFENGQLFSVDSQSAQSAFNQDKINELNVPDYKSREKLIEMNIADFLDLSRSGKEPEKLANAKQLLKDGKQFRDLPFLQIEADGRVTGHEGRHRARALMAAGYKTMPVILRSANIRWSEQNDPKKSDYIESWPARISAEKNAVSERFNIVFPVKREDAMKPYMASSDTDPNGPKKMRSVQSKSMAIRELASQFKAQTGDNIAVAGTKMAGQEVRRASGKVEADLYTPEQVAMIDQWEAMRNPSSKYLFHTTPAVNLQNIAKNGLKPGSKARFEGVGNGELSFGANEATSAYYGSASDVMLRVSNKFKFSKLNPDLLSGDGAYTTPDTIPASALEVKAKGKWVPLLDYVNGQKPKRVMSLEQKELADEATVQIIDRQQKLASDLSLFEKFVIHPRTIASFNKEFVPVYQSAVEQFEERDRINAMLTRSMTDYTELTDSEKLNVNRFLEIGRLSGEVLKKGDTTLTDKEFAGYKAVRFSMDAALDMFKEQFIVEQGFDPKTIKSEKDILSLITDAMPESMVAAIKRSAQVIREIEQAKRQGYVPFTRYGQIGVYVKDEEGETLHFEKVEIDGYKDKARRLIGKDKVIENIPAVKALMEDLAKRYPNAQKIGAFEVGKQSKEEVNLADLDRLANVAEIDTDVWSEVSEALKMAVKAKGFRKHFFGSTNVPGYSRDFERGLADYITGISGYLARRKYNKKFDDSIASIPNTMPRMKEYADKYREYINNPVEEAQAIRQAAFLYYIAGNLSTAIVNLTQQFMSVSYLSQFTGLIRSKAEMLRANRDAALMFNPTLELFTPEKAPADVRKLVQKAWDSGLFVPLQTYENLGTAHNRSKVMRGLNEKVRKGIEIAALSFTAAERLNRIATFIATVRLAQRDDFKKKAAKVLAKNPLAKAELKGNDFAYKMAELVIDETHYRMGKVNRPSFMRGAIGAPVTQFKSFMFQTLELMVRTAALNGPEGKRAALYILAVFLILGGAFGLPFAESAVQLAEMAYKKATGEEVDFKAEARLLLADKVGPRAAEIATSGAGPLMGVDLQSKAGMGDIVPMSVSDVLGIPLALTFGRLGDAMMYANQDRHEAMVGALLPNFAANLLQSYEWGTDGVRKKTTGQMVIKSDELSSAQLGAKAIGFTPSEVTAIRSAEYAITRENYRLREKLARYHAKLGRIYADMQEAQGQDAISDLELEAEAVIREVDEYNENREPADKILLNNDSIKQAVERELIGRKANDKKVRKASRAKANEIREAFTGQYLED